MQPVMYVVSSRGRRVTAAADGPRVSARVAERTREQAGSVSPADSLGIPLRTSRRSHQQPPTPNDSHSAHLELALPLRFFQQLKRPPLPLPAVPTLSTAPSTSSTRPRACGNSRRVAPGLSRASPSTRAKLPTKRAWLSEQKDELMYYSAH